MANKATATFNYWWAKLPAPLQNKYLLTLVFFCGWLLFFDKNNVIAQWKLQTKVDELKTRRHFYTTQMVVVQTQIEELLANPQKLEKYAREQYRMKRDNEDIFVIEEK